MFRKQFLLAIFVALALPFALLAEEPKVKKIFDGKSLENFEFNDEHWRVEEGAIVGEIRAGQTLKNNEFIFWKGDVADFELTLQFKIEGDKSANSGIQFRSVRTKEGGAIGYQADLDLGDVWLGRIYDEHARALLTERGQRVSIAPDGRRWKDEFAPVGDFKALAKPTEWQTYHLKAYGPHVEVWINGKLFSVLDDHQMGEADYKGRLGFQLHSGPGPVKLQFKEIELKHIGETKFPGQAPTIDDPKNRQTQSAALWHLRPNPAKPTPIENEAAQATVASMMVTEGFQVELIAAEPDLHQPIAFTFDERGRIWVVEAHSYPNKQPRGQGKDKIRIFEDVDGDGFFETHKTFIKGLNLVTGIEVGFGGVWVGAAPHLLFIPDADKNDLPDGPPKILLEGFGYQDTHETLNSFQWGPDGWLYGNQGVFNTASIGKPKSEEMPWYEPEKTTLRAGVWRYHPTKHLFEVFAHGGSNQWGLAFNDMGHLFMTHCRSYWGGGGTTYVIRNGHYWNQTNSNYPDFISNSAPPGIPHLMNFLPASAKYDSGEGGAGKKGTDLVYGGHSHVGTMIYLGDNWPDIYRDHVFTHNLHGHQINHQHNVREGSGYETLHAGSDILYCPDPAYVPVDLKFGPDGAVYIIDWVDKQHCHNPRGETWDRTNGRIYRLSWKDTFKPVKVDLGAMSDVELVKLQTHKNRWYGRTARRILQERFAKQKNRDRWSWYALGGDNSMVKEIANQFASQEPSQQLAALWTLNTNAESKVDTSIEMILSLQISDTGREMLKDLLGLTQETASLPLQPLDDEVDAWITRLGFDKYRKRDFNEEAAVRETKSAPVLLEYASILQDREDWNRGELARALLSHSEIAEDRFLPKMIWYGIGQRGRYSNGAADYFEQTRLPQIKDWVCWQLAKQDFGMRLLMRKIVGTADSAEAKRLLTILHFGLPRDYRPDEAKLKALLEKSPGYVRYQQLKNDWRLLNHHLTEFKLVAKRFAESKDPQVIQMVRELLGVFGDEEVLSSMRKQLADAKAPLEQRRNALAVLSRANDEKAMAIYLALLSEPALRTEAIGMLAPSSDPQVADKLLAGFNAFDDAGKVAALGVLTSRPAFAKALLSAIESKTFDKDSLTALQITQIHFLGDADLQKQVVKIYGKVGGTSEEAKATIEKLKNTFTTAPLWAYSAGRGAETFKKHCAACHSVDGKASPLGPSLAGSWRHGLNYFLDNIVDPNAVVGENFRTTLITTDAGIVHSGLLESETDTAVVLRTAEKQITVPKSEIEDRKLIEQSIMPTGLLDKLSEEEVIELLKYLTERK